MQQKHEEKSFHNFNNIANFCLFLFCMGFPYLMVYVNKRFDASCKGYLGD